MHEERLRQNIDDGIRYWIKKPIVIIEENLMKRHKNRSNPIAIKKPKKIGSSIPTAMVATTASADHFSKRSKKHETGDQRYEQYTIV